MGVNCNNLALSSKWNNNTVQRILANSRKATLWRNIRCLHPMWQCAAVIWWFSESCPLLSQRYVPTRHTQLDKCLAWPSKFVFLPLNCDFISLGQARRRACVCMCARVSLSLWTCVAAAPAGFEKGKKTKKKRKIHPDGQDVHLTFHIFHQSVHCLGKKKKNRPTLEHVCQAVGILISELTDQSI